jgi:hypothetical protein
MLIPVAVLVAILSVVLTGGRLSAVIGVRLRWSALILLALALQVLIISAIPGAPITILAAVHVLTYILAGAFLIVNRTVPGLWLVAMGGLANMLAISANGGFMPASPAALETAGMAVDVEGFANSTAIDGARLWVLGDIFAIPAGWPLANVFSIGDVLIVLGVAVGLHRICGSRLVPRTLRMGAHHPVRVRARTLHAGA